jgi:uncharacterized small protein (DUF1192 family)
MSDAEAFRAEVVARDDFTSQDVALLAEMVNILASEVQRLREERDRKHWWQFWRPQPSETWAKVHLTMWSLTRDIRNVRDPNHTLHKFWDRGGRWYV